MAPRHIIVALALVVLVAFLVAQNGTGRPTGSDKARMSDLRDLSGFVYCTADVNDGTLPEELAPFERCGRDIRLAEEATGTPYGYRKIDALTYEVCAGFDKPERVADLWFGRGTFDPATGCATVTRRE